MSPVSSSCLIPNDINLQEGNTPLHAAAAEGMLKVMKKLVAHADADQSLRSLVCQFFIFVLSVF